MLDMLRRELFQTFVDLAPIALILGFFWARFLGADRSIVHRTLIGVLHLTVGLTLFRIGLDSTLLPLGADLARALSERAVAQGGGLSFTTVVAFAVTLGAAAALIEPTLAATADRVRELSGGTIHPLVLRVAVATGIGIGLGLGVTRLILGFPLGLMLFPMVALMVALAFVAPRGLVPLALDSGAIATSVVTVPVIAAYGVAVADTLPDRTALADGFGLIVLAMVGSALTVLATATLEDRLRHSRNQNLKNEGEGP